MQTERKTQPTDDGQPKASDSGQWPATQVDLLARIQQPYDEDAWSTFVGLYSPLILRFCQKRGLQEADARDVTQEVLTRINRVIGQFQYDATRGRFRGWLGTMIRHAIFIHHKRTGRDTATGGEQHTLESVPGKADSNWIDEFGDNILKRALARIRPEFDDETWNAFDATWNQELTARQVAVSLQKPIEWIYKAKFRVLRRLKAEVESLASDSVLA